LRFWSNDALDDHTAGRLAEYERKTGRKVEPPVPVELLAEEVFDLRLSYEPVEGVPGLSVFGCLNPAKRTVYVNTDYRALFTEKPGLERFTVAHEVGHWDLFEQHNDKETGSLFGVPAPEVLNCRTRGGVPAKFIRRLWRGSDAFDVLSFLQSRKDSPTVASAVDRYASAMLMPKSLLLLAFRAANVRDWPDLYAIRDRFQVSITALVIRLERLKQIFVTEDKQIFLGTREEYEGQQRIAF
jgi:Zn-dependent peptidase ImmA (M78 family)